MSDYFTKNIALIEKIRTWQGEGCNCGKRMNLIRFKYCNRHCPFCDTWTKMKEIKENLYSINDIDNDLRDVKNIMITGGEPLFKNHTKDGILSNYDATLEILKTCGFEYADIETNGSQNLLDFLDEVETIKSNDSDEYHVSRHSKKINVSWSPKFSSKDDISKYIELCEDISRTHCDKDETLEYIITPVIKLVIASELEKEFLYKIINDGLYDRNKIYLMPLGCSYKEIQKSFPDVVRIATDLGCHVSSRLHLVHNFD